MFPNHIQHESGELLREVKEVRLTVMPSFMREALVKQLTERRDLARFDFCNSAYFKKYICLADVSLMQSRNSHVKVRNMNPLMLSSYTHRGRRMSTRRLAKKNPELIKSSYLENSDFEE